MPLTQLRLFTEESDRQAFQPPEGEQSPREADRRVADPFAVVPHSGRELIVGELVSELPSGLQDLTPSEPGPLPRIVNSHLVLWVVLLSLGPLGLPLFWISPRYHLWSKLLITVMTLGLTIVFPIALTLYFSDFAMQPLLKAIQDANQAGGAH